jgi:hypothetical protein
MTGIDRPQRRSILKVFSVVESEREKERERDRGKKGT